MRVLAVVLVISLLLAAAIVACGSVKPKSDCVLDESRLDQCTL